jgi:hypothetical protein
MQWRSISRRTIIYFGGIILYSVKKKIIFGYIKMQINIDLSQLKKRYNNGVRKDLDAC